MGWFNCEFRHSPSPLKCDFFINLFQLNSSITNLLVFGSIHLVQWIYHLGGKILFPLTYSAFQQCHKWNSWWGIHGCHPLDEYDHPDVQYFLSKSLTYFIELLMFEWKGLIFMIFRYWIPDIKSSFFRGFWPWWFWYF